MSPWRRPAALALVLMAGQLVAGCLGGEADQASASGHDMEIEPGGWQGVPFDVGEISHVAYRVSPAEGDLVDICLVDVTDGPMPTTGRPASAIGCHTSLHSQAASTVLPAGRYSLAIGCFNVETPCEVDHTLTVTVVQEPLEPPTPV